MLAGMILSGCDSPPKGMVLVSGGNFTMGSDKVDTDQHALRVGLNKPWYVDESPSLKRANWRGKQMSETIPPPAELVIVDPDTPKGIRIGVRTGNSELSKLFQATKKRKKGLVGRYGNKDIW